MQQIVSFLFNYRYQFLFFFLLFVSLFLTIQNNEYHRYKAISSANFLSGFVYEKQDNITSYFHLKEDNNLLIEENRKLKELLFNKKDTVLDTKIFFAEALNYKVYSARIINNTFNKPNNYLTLNKGSEEEIQPDMGVINEKGVIGVIDKTTKKYATIRSILNTKTRINAKLKGQDHFGTIVWNAENVGFVQLIEMPRLASINKGDTIVTGSQSILFPENIPIGKIDRAYQDTITNYYTIDVRLFNDMTSLGNVSVIDNRKKKEMLQIEKIKDEQ